MMPGDTARAAQTGWFMFDEDLADRMSPGFVYFVTAIPIGDPLFDDPDFRPVAEILAFVRLGPAQLLHSITMPLADNADDDDDDDGGEPSN